MPGHYSNQGMLIFLFIFLFHSTLLKISSEQKNSFDKPIEALRRDLCREMQHMRRRGAAWITVTRAF